MNNRIVYSLFHMFARRGFSVLRFNFRGVGRSPGRVRPRPGRAARRGRGARLDAAHNPNSSGCWVAGFSFGAWIAMQLLMRRPEIQGFMCASLPANMYDFGFLAPCPASGLIVARRAGHGDAHRGGGEAGQQALASSAASPSTTSCSKAPTTSSPMHMGELEEICEAYLNKRLKPAERPLAMARCASHAEPRATVMTGSAPSCCARWTSAASSTSAPTLAALDALAAARPVTAYVGFDCTADSLHVGHLVSIMMLRCAAADRPPADRAGRRRHHQGRRPLVPGREPPAADRRADRGQQGRHHALARPLPRLRAAGAAGRQRRMAGRAALHPVPARFRHAFHRQPDADLRLGAASGWSASSR